MVPELEVIKQVYERMMEIDGKGIMNMLSNWHLRPRPCVSKLQKARVLEFQVRMDCNGCVQRIKRAMHGIDGVYNVNIDLASQKLTVVGTADPEKIVKAIKKTRKIATICSHTENTGPEQPPPPTEPAPSSDPPASDTANQPPAEPPKDDVPSQDNAVVQVEKPSPEAKDAVPVHLTDVGEIPMVVHQYPYDCIQKGQWNYYYPQRQGAIPYHPPYYVIQSYNYRSAPYPPQDIRYAALGPYDEDGYWHHGRGGDRNQITSVFSEENPSTCRIV
ncbi:unnamed protein product [Musa textilis]